MNATAFDRIIAALEQRGLQVRSTGTSKAQAQCAAHEDRAPSLSVTGIEGQVLVYCHAGCAIEDVLAALSLGKADLYDQRGANYRYNDGREVKRFYDETGAKRFTQRGTTKALPHGAFLYHLDRLEPAVRDGKTVYVVEGEKDVHALESLGAVATCSPMGAGKASKANWTPLAGATVVIVADQDEPGRRHADQVREILTGLRCTTRIVRPAVGKDAADHVAAGYGVQDLVEFNSQVLVEFNSEVALGPVGPEAQPVGAGSGPTGPEPADGGRKSAATTLVELAQARYTFGISADGEPFATPIMGDPVTLLLRGGRRGLRSELARAYYQQHGKAAPQQALADALLVVEGMANEAVPEPLAQRVAETSSGWWIDLGDASGDAIQVNGTGWKITAPPVKFRRTVLTAALPRPVPGGDLAELWDVLNVAEQDRPLVLAWLIAAMVADVPHPVLSLAGEQGTGKSTAARIITSLIDPSPVPLRKAPRDADSWVTAAAGSWCVAIDNVSTVPDWLSDTLCRAVTGDGDVRRQLYTDGGLAVFAFRRAIILTGIDLGALRGDLADRLLVIDLDVIGERSRRLDAEITNRWAESCPRVLGALLASAASVASVLSSVRLERSPRMADFARILAAVDQVLGTDGLRRYLDRAKTLAADALSADPFVVAMLAQLVEPFVGTSADLLAAIRHGQDKAPKGWPANARAVTSLLKRQAPVMRRAGWTVTEQPAGHDNAIRWEIRRPEKACNPDSQHSRHSQDGPGASIASVASVEYGPSQDGHPPLAVDVQACTEPGCTSPPRRSCRTCFEHARHEHQLAAS